MSRQERIKIERPSAKSFFAFFLLPQFWRSFEHFHHIRPIFIQTLALSFASAGLLPLNHPATRFGEKFINGRKIKMFGLIGEAWYNLRNRPNMGMYQWGVFSAVVLMFSTLIGAVLLGIFYFLSGEIAKAQMFDHPTGLPTDLMSVPVAGAGVLYDRSAIGGHQDLAIGILDKVLRQGANGTGGSMQNSIGVMFGTYSTAVLVLASVLIFLSITAMVVDTARTGKLGGGRRNMVWTPIRFVFAIGLLVPIGGAFNSGQFIVMKLAEMGSNLGSNIWNTYVTGTADLSLLVNRVNTASPTSVLEPILSTMNCVKQYNIYSEVGLGSAVFTSGTYPATPLSPAMPPMTSAAWGAVHPEYVRPIIDQQAVAGNQPNIPINFGNDNDPTICGSINLPNPMGNDIVNYDPAYTAQFGVAVGAPFDEIAAFKQQVRQAEWNTLNNLRGDIEQMACHTISLTEGGAPGLYANSCPTGATYANACNGANAGGYGGQPISASCYHDLVDRYVTQRDASLAAAKAAFLDPYVSPGGGLVTESARQGWAGMGAWYYKLAGVNRAFSSGATPDVGGEGGGQGSSNITQGETNTTSLVSGGGMNTNGGGAVQGTTDTAVVGNAWQGSEQNSGFPFSFSDISPQGGVKVIKWILKKMQVGDGALLVTIGGYNAQAHPIAELSAAGSQIIDKAILIYGLMAGISLLAGILGALGNFLGTAGGLIEALMMGPVGGLMGMVAAFGLVPGMMIMYYVPLIPWVRVMFGVMAWIVAVVEAVVTMPLIALAHIRTTGDGLTGPMARKAYFGWLNLLLRPALVVIGFVMGNLIFEAMILYLNDTYARTLAGMGSGGLGIIDQAVNTFMYAGAAYALVNASFKLVDIIPNTTMKWLGGPRAESFEDEATTVESWTNDIMEELSTGIGKTLPNVATKSSLAIGMKGTGATMGAASAIRNRIRGSA